MSNNYPHWKIVWFMAESYLFDEKQKSDENDVSELIKWKSLTDSCLWIEKTEKMLEIF